MTNKKAKADSSASLRNDKPKGRNTEILAFGYAQARMTNDNTTADSLLIDGQAHGPGLKPLLPWGILCGVETPRSLL
jgi:hypothetical protein